MGQLANFCGEDVFKKLFSEYGDDFMKLVIAEKSKSVIRDKFRDLNTESDNIISEFSAKINVIVNSKLDSLDRNFESAKSSVQSIIPGGISTLERIKGQSINQFSGYNKLQSKVNGIKGQALTNVDNKKNQVMNDLNVKQGEMISVIEHQRPKVPIYEELPQPLRQQLLKKGEKQFGKQIQANKETIIKRLMNQFLPESFRMLGTFLNQINPQNPLSSILNNSFNQLAGNITLANQSGSGGGGFMNNFRQIF